jgi:fermentation-respiration switch protein FrsA (DUF1100 family)
MATGVVSLLAVAGFGALLGLTFLEEKFAFHPSKVIEMTPEAVGLEFEDVRIISSDGEQITGWWIPASSPGPALLFLHGNAGNISHRLHALALLQKAGLSVLIIDYRGYGQSSGAPSEEGIYLDAASAWRHLVGKRELTASKIVVYGESIGSAPALNLVRELESRGKQPPGALILEGAFTSALEMGRRIFPFLPLKLILKMKMDNLDAIRHVTTPTLLLHAGEDEIVPIEMGKALHQASAATEKEFRAVPEARHNTVWMVRGDEVQQIIRQFVQIQTNPL